MSVFLAMFIGFALKIPLPYFPGAAVGPGPPGPGGSGGILLEVGSGYILLEDGSFILLE